MFKQLGQDLYEIAEDLRAPITDLARNTLDHAFLVTRSVMHGLSDLLDDAIHQTTRFRGKLGSRI